MATSGDFLVATDSRPMRMPVDLQLHSRSIHIDRHAAEHTRSRCTCRRTAADSL